MHAQPLAAYYHDTITYKVAVYAPAERADTLPEFHLYPICNYGFPPSWDGAFRFITSLASPCSQAGAAVPATPNVLRDKLTALLATFAERNGKVPSWLCEVIS
jgi:hypothetical protein